MYFNARFNIVIGILEIVLIEIIIVRDAVIIISSTAIVNKQLILFIIINKRLEWMIVRGVLVFWYDLLLIDNIYLILTKLQLLRHLRIVDIHTFQYSKKL